MSKDYKQRPARKKAPGRKKAPPPPRRWPAFVSGLVVGVLGTVAVFVYEPGEQVGKVIADATGGKDSKAGTRFEFYTVLPDKEMAIPDSELDVAVDEPSTPTPAPTPAPQAGTVSTAAPAPAPAADAERIVLQVGSFQSPGDADRLKAELALLGLESNVQTISLDTGQTWHRVQVGPLSDRKTIADAHSTLTDNGHDILPLKLK